MSEQVAEMADAARDQQEVRDVLVVIARPDGVVQGTPEQAAATQFKTFPYVTISTERSVFLLLDEALPDDRPAKRWQVRVEQSGVLSVSAWLDAQDRDEDDAQTVMILAPGVWKAVRSPFKVIGED